MPSQVWPRTQSRRKGHHYYKAHLVTIFYLIGPVWGEPYPINALVSEAIG